MKKAKKDKDLKENLNKIEDMFLVIWPIYSQNKNPKK
jgi:hypothetical protein